ncbi:MAG: hypothetical protein ABFR19_10235, partial [Pseudomonadota bacterium]
MKDNKLRKQLKTNTLALISLFVAFSALGYNTWRNELTEENRNIRAAGFEMLLHIGQLQRIAYLAHYDRDLQQGNPRSGWVEVLVLRDLGMLMPEGLEHYTEQLFDSWKENWQELGRDDESAVAAIDNAINDLRKNVLAGI